MSADTPTNDAQTIDHRRMRIGPDQRVGEINVVTLKNALCQVLEINLVNDADAGRN